MPVSNSCDTDGQSERAFYQYCFNEDIKEAREGKTRVLMAEEKFCARKGGERPQVNAFEKL